MKGHMSDREASCKWGASESCAYKLCQQGRIPGLERSGRSWVIPADAEKPQDPRSGRKTGKETSDVKGTVRND